jgi:hypothetical protein
MTGTIPGFLAPQKTYRIKSYFSQTEAERRVGRVHSSETFCFVESMKGCLIGAKRRYLSCEIPVARSYAVPVLDYFADEFTWSASKQTEELAFMNDPAVQTGLPCGGS